MNLQHQRPHLPITLLLAGITSLLIATREYTEAKAAIAAAILAALGAFSAVLGAAWLATHLIATFQWRERSTRTAGTALLLFAVLAVGGSALVYVLRSGHSGAEPQSAQLAS